jgi:transposase
MLFVDQLTELSRRIIDIELRIRCWHAQNETSRRLATIPGIGPITATAIAATVPDPSVFRNGRDFAAWLGLVPRQNSTSGKDRLGGITKRGDGYLRRLLIIGAQAVLRSSKTAQADPWVTGLLARKPRMVVAVAAANKMARIAWAIMSRMATYQPSAATN